MDQIIVDASKKRFSINFKELWAYKDLFLVLAYRDYRVRYSQTFLGLVWAFIQPFTTLIIFIIVFGKAARIDTSPVPYPLFAVCGMAAWTYFSFVLSQSGSSIISSQAMIQKIYFPRLIIPLSKALVGLVDFGITFIFVIVLLIVYKHPPSINLLFLPGFILINLIAALGVGIWLSALTIRYRDFQHVIPFLVQFGLYATPVAYPAHLIIKSLSPWAVTFYYLNPMAGVVEGFRWSIIGGAAPNAYCFVSFTMVLIIFITSLVYFRKTERIMADIV